MESKSDRAQFRVSKAQLSWLKGWSAAAKKSKHWPDAVTTSDKTRFSVRMLYRRATSPTDWKVVRGSSEEALVIPDSPPSGDAVCDVMLAAWGDRQLVEQLMVLLERSQADVLRTSLAFAQQIATYLRSQWTLAETNALGGHTQIDLHAIVAEEEQRAGVGVLPLQSRELVPLVRLDPPRGGRDADPKLMVLACLTRGFNHFAVSRVAFVTRALEAAGAASDALVEQLDLSRLLEEYSSQSELIAQGLKDWKDAGLVPSKAEWRDPAPDVISECCGVLRTYLEACTAFHTPWGRPSQPWRHWARTLRSGDDLECDAPLHWGDVIRHYLLRSGQDDAAAQHEVQRALLDAFDLRHKAHFDGIAGVCAAVNELFYDAAVVSSERLHRGSEVRVKPTDLLARIEGPLRKEEDDDVRKQAAGLYLFLNVAGYLRTTYRWSSSAPVPEVTRRIRSLTSLEFTEFRARVFGAQTAIDGLRAVLHGGILPRPGLGRIWVITGEAGSAKSSMALHLAADMAARGRLAIVVTAEERASAIEERLTVFGLRNPRYRVVTREQFESMLEDGFELADDQGLLVVFGAVRVGEQLDLKEWIKETANKVDAIRAKGSNDLWHRWRWRAVVIDSVDSLQIEGPSQASSEHSAIDTRKTMFDLARAIEDHGFWGILLCGADYQHLKALAHAADTVIRLGLEPGSSTRTFEIAKCRAQPYDAGPHVLDLDEGRGVRIYPSLASFQRRIQRRPRPVLDIDRYLSLPDVIQAGFWPASDATTSGGLLRGSSALLWGPSQSGKSATFLHLLSTPLKLTGKSWDLGPAGGVLIVSFRAVEDEYKRVIAESAHLRRCFANGVCDLQLRWYAPGMTLRGSHIVSQLERRLRESRQKRIQIERIVFDGIDGLRTNLPGVAADASFWPTVIGMTAAESITTMFVVDTGGGQRSEFVENYGLDIDYVMKFERESASKPECVVRLEKSPDRLFSSVTPSARFRVRDGEIVASTPSSPPLDGPEARPKARSPGK